MTGARFTIIWHSTSLGLHAKMVKLFFGRPIHLYLAEGCCKNLQSTKGPAQCMVNSESQSRLSAIGRAMEPDPPNQNATNDSLL